MDQPTDEYAIYAGSDETVALAPRAHGRHKALARLIYCYEGGQDLAEQWGFPTDDIVKAREREDVLKQLLQESEGEEAERYKERLQAVQQRLESAPQVEPIGYETYLKKASELVFDVDTIELERLDVEAAQRGISDFLLRCRGSSLEQAEQSSAQMSGLGDFLQSMAEMGT